MIVVVKIQFWEFILCRCFFYAVLKDQMEGNSCTSFVPSENVDIILEVSVLLLTWCKINCKKMCEPPVDVTCLPATCAAFADTE